MSRNLLVPEVEVLVAAALWLWDRGAAPVQVSIAVGFEAGKHADRRRFETALNGAGVPSEWTTSSDGPDLIAVSPTECWQVECKGTGTGVASTQRNNFDRALSSVVSYYGNLPGRLLARYPTPQVVGLAVPDTEVYMRELRRRVSQPLRQALNLWVLLYNSEQRIISVAPDQLIPA